MSNSRWTPRQASPESVAFLEKQRRREELRARVLRLQQEQRDYPLRETLELCGLPQRERELAALESEPDTPQSATPDSAPNIATAYALMVRELELALADNKRHLGTTHDTYRQRARVLEYAKKAAELNSNANS